MNNKFIQSAENKFSRMLNDFVFILRVQLSTYLQALDVWTNHFRGDLSQWFSKCERSITWEPIRYKFLRPNPDILKKKLWEWALAICVLTAPAICVFIAFQVYFWGMLKFKTSYLRKSMKPTVYWDFSSAALW